MKGKGNKLRERGGPDCPGMCPLGGSGYTNIPLSQVKKGWQELMRVSSKIFPLLEIR